jgi:hypothetical protein
MKFILAIALLALSGCATSQTPNPAYNIQFEAQPNLPEKSIRWVVVENVSAVCQNKIPALSGQRILACSEYNNRACTIYTGRTTDMAIVGHEIRHCFEGAWHR